MPTGGPGPVGVACDGPLMRMWIRRVDLRLPFGLAAVLCVVYLVVQPLSPDLSAQLARAGAASRGAGLWWAGWFGGINTSTYSVLSGSVMGLLGVATFGVVATVVICAAGTDLLRRAVRPRAGAVAVTLAACSNLYSGRVTFAAGMALSLTAFCCLQRGWNRAGALLGAASGLVSPLAAMCHVIGLVPDLVHGPRRRAALMLVTTVLPVGVVSVLFSQPSFMPFSGDILTYGLLVSAGVALSPVPQPVRLLAVISAIVAVGCWLVPSPIGSNAVRLPMLAAAPLVVAYARRGRRWTRAIVAGLLIWPVLTVTSDMAIAAQPSSSQRFYANLLTHLPAAGEAVQRVEVLDPESHAASYYLSAQVPVARGWERQIDAAANPLFYDGTLTAQTYRAWLIQHAVGWIAVPASRLDYGSLAERALIRTHPAFLSQTWSDHNWSLYRVTVAAPAANGPFTVTGLLDHAVTFTASGSGSGTFTVPWSRLLTVRSDQDATVTGCVTKNPSGQVDVTVPGPGAYRLIADPDPASCPGATPSPTQP